MLRFVSRVPKAFKKSILFVGKLPTSLLDLQSFTWLREVTFLIKFRQKLISDGFRIQFRMCGIIFRFMPNKNKTNRISHLIHKNGIVA